jgi:hypothetical protein
VSELQVLVKSCNKRKGVDHEVGVAFCLPTRGWKRRRRVRSQHQLLVQTNLAKIKARKLCHSEKLHFSTFQPSSDCKGRYSHHIRPSFLVSYIADTESKPSLPCGKLLDSNWRWILDPSRAKSLERQKKHVFSWFSTPIIAFDFRYKTKSFQIINFIGKPMIWHLTLATVMPPNFCTWFSTFLRPFFGQICKKFQHNSTYNAQSVELLRFSLLTIQ